LKWCRRAAAVFAFGLAIAAWAGLPEWLEHTPVTGQLVSVFMRQAPMPGGPVTVRRPAQETRAELTQLVMGTPGDAELRALRAREAEQQLDFPAAESDWKEFVKLVPDQAAGRVALADFYHRRLQPADELRELTAAAEAPAQAREKFTPVSEQRSWRTFERAVALIEAQSLPLETATAEYRAWVARYPAEPQAHQKLVEFLIARKQFAAASESIAAYRKAFPADEVFPVREQARMEQERGAGEASVAVYDRAFQPLWPPELVKDYFAQLQKTGNLRRFLEQARIRLAANPNDVSAVARIFYYWQQQGNMPQATRALVEFRLKKRAWSAGSCSRWRVCLKGCTSTRKPFAGIARCTRWPVSRTRMRSGRWRVSSTRC
jgi:cellulose synthase operon protein C